MITPATTALPPEALSASTASSAPALLCLAKRHPVPRMPLLLMLVFAASSVLPPRAFSQPPPMAVVSPEVGADRKITFRMLAPNAKEVTVGGEFARSASPMVKSDAGVWSVTIGPLAPNVYGYGFRVDGLNMPDPCNTFVRVGSLAFQSQVEVPGDEAAFLAIRDVPHGELRQLWYFSKALNAVRRVLVYTPPEYETDRAKAFPVLYLLHGMGDDEAFWTTVGRANFIADNLLADKKAIPALIVMPFGHASRNMRLGPRPAGAAAANANPAPGGGFFEVAMLEQELKDNIIPLVETRYRVRKDRNSRAIAGLSMGGYQAMAIGLNNLPLFASVGAFSSALVGPDFSQVVPRFLAQPDKANQQLKLLWLGCGADDGLLATNQKFEAVLTAKGITHEWVISPGYAHWWTLWRVYLRDLMGKLFVDK